MPFLSPTFAEIRTLRFGETLSISEGEVATLKCGSISYSPSVGEEFNVNTVLEIFGTIQGEVEVLAPVPLPLVCPVIGLNSTVGIQALDENGPPICEFAVEGPIDFELRLIDDGVSVVPQDYKANVIVEISDNPPLTSSLSQPSLPVPPDGVFLSGSATGQQQLILESSEDLISWHLANPGVYGAESDNRFFQLGLEGNLPQSQSFCQTTSNNEELVFLRWGETLSIPEDKVAFFQCAIYYYDSLVDFPTEVDEILLFGTINSEVVVIPPTILKQFCPVWSRGGNAFTTSEGPFCNFVREGPIDFHLSVESGSTFPTLEVEVLIALRDKNPAPPACHSGNLNITANAAVIPSDADGPVEVKVEVSTDGQNWTETSPGILAASVLDRVYRVRVIQN